MDETGRPAAAAAEMGVDERLLNETALLVGILAPCSMPKDWPQASTSCQTRMPRSRLTADLRSPTRINQTAGGPIGVVQV